MKIEVRCQGKLRSKALIKWAHEKVVTSLDRFSARIKSVRISLTDINGRRGGEDKNCVAQVSLVSGQTISVAVCDSDAYRAAEWLARQLRFQVARGIERSRVRALQA